LSGRCIYKEALFLNDANQAGSAGYGLEQQELLKGKIEMHMAAKAI